MARNIVMTTAGQVIVQTKISSGFFQIFAYTSSSTAAIWGLKSAAAGTTLNINFAETNANIYSFGVQGADYMISRILVSTGAVQWTFSAPHNNLKGFQSLELLVHADSSSFLIAATGTTTKRRYAQLGISPAGIVIYSMQFTEGPTTDPLQISGLFIVDASHIKVLLFSTTTFITSIASIDFNVPSITYLKILPALNSFVYLGRFVSQNKFYIGVRQLYVIYDLSKSTTISSKLQSEIISSDPTESCYTMQSAPSTSGTMTASTALTDSSTTSYFTKLTILFTLNTPASTDVVELISTEMTQNNMAFSNLASVQTSTTITSVQGIQITFSITPFQGTYECGPISNPPFTYALVPNTLSFISVDPTIGAVTISTASVAGSYSIVIQGTYTPSGQIILQPLTVIVTPNFIVALVDQTVSSGHSNNYSLPSTSSPTPVITIQSITPAASWITLAGTSIAMSPSYTDQGTFSVTMQLTLGTIVISFPFNVVSSNTPPQFVTVPTSKTISTGHTSTYTLPLTTDIDGDSITISLTTTCIYLVSQSSGVITMVPTISDVGSCSVTLNLFDGINNVLYPINIVTISNSPPYFSSSLSPGETINAGLSNTYNLPATNDIDGDIVTISISQGSSVVASLAGIILTLNPSVSQVGSFPINIILSDGFNQHTFTYTVVSINTPPYFSTIPLHSQTLVAGGQGITNILLPSIVDSEQTLSQITVFMLPSTYSIISLIGKLTVSINPLCSIPASTYTEFLNIFDGFNNVQNAMSVTVTPNQNPTFSVSFLPLNLQCVSITMNVLFSDPENQAVTFSIIAPSWVSYSSISSGVQLIINPYFNMPSGNFSVSIQITDNCFPVTHMITQQINVQTNRPPAFNTQFLTDQSVSIGQTQNYVLPPSSDFEMTPYTITASYLGSNIPSFIIFDGSQFVMNPTASDLGIFELQVQLNDGCSFSEYPLKILVNALLDPRSMALSNIGPPMFITALTDIVILAGDSLIYNLPKITDQDNDSFKIDIDLQQTIPFARTANNSIIFFPTNQDAKLIPYKIIIFLTDNNTSPKQKQYHLLITVNSLPKAIVQNTTGSDKKLSDSTLPVPNQQVKICNVKITQYFSQQSLQKGDIILKFDAANLREMVVDKINNTNIEIRFKNKLNTLVIFNITKKNINNGHVQISLFFEDPSQISSSKILDQIQVKIINDIEINMYNVITKLNSGTSVIITLPPQLSPFMVQMAVTIQKSGQIIGGVVTVGTVMISIFLAPLMSYIFGFLNDLSFMMLLSFISINIQGLPKTIQQTFLTVIYVDLFQISMWAPSIFQSEDSDLPLNDQFSFVGWSTTRVIPNIGSAIFYLMIIPTLIALQIVLFKVGSCTFPQRYQFFQLNKLRLEKWLRSKLYWNSILRFIIQQYAPLLLASLINIFQVINSYQQIPLAQI